MIYFFTETPFLFPDIDECNLKKPVCAQECVNTKGSYFCRCAEGFQLNKDGSNCTGIPNIASATV